MAKAPQTLSLRNQATKAHLVKAAEELFADLGFTGATIDMIVQRAGFSKGAFYFYFTTKEEIFLEVLQIRGRSQEEILRNAGRATTAPIELLRAIAAYLNPRADDTIWPKLLIEFWSQASRNDKVRDGVETIVYFRRQSLLETLEAAKQAGLIKPGLSLEQCLDLLLTISDGLIAKAGTGQRGPTNGYLRVLIAGILGIPTNSQF